MVEVSLSATRALPRHHRFIGTVARIRLVSALAIVGAYEGLARSGLLYQDVLPSLVAVLRALFALVGTADFYRHLGATVLEIALGFGIGTGLGLALGIAFGVWRLLGETLDPWVHYLAPTPKIVFLPVLILVFGTGMGSKIAMGAIAAFFPVVVATFAGMRLVRPVLIKVARSFQASTWQIVRMIHAPSLLLAVIGAMRIALGATIIGTLLAEFKMSREGLGYLIVQDYNALRVPEMYSLLLIVFVLALAANACMGWLKKHLARR